jgi:hypothetical protein
MSRQRPPTHAARANADRVTFSFRAEPGARNAIEDLARREAACCPFLDQRVEADGEEEVVWTLVGTP